MDSTSEKLQDRTISDFGEQWSRYVEADGHWGSTELFRDILGELLDASELHDARIADIGSGTGRIVRMLLNMDAGHLTAVEPSSAFQHIKPNLTSEQCERLEIQNVTGDQLKLDEPYDYLFSFGVLHHIPEPTPVVERAYQALKPGGKLCIWLYGHEGNGAYLACARPMRAITVRIPDGITVFISRILALILQPYIGLCRMSLPLPMSSYMRYHFGPLSFRHQMLTVYDQLNPAYAKYYREAEARQLVESAGFQNVQMFNRHGYSWTVVGEKPSSDE